jgi:hypothetical protein
MVCPGARFFLRRIRDQGPKGLQGPGISRPCSPCSPLCPWVLFRVPPRYLWNAYETFTNTARSARRRSPEGSWPTRPLAKSIVSPRVKLPPMREKRRPHGRRRLDGQGEGREQGEGPAGRAGPLAPHHPSPFPRREKREKTFERLPSPGEGGWEGTGEGSG